MEDYEIVKLVLEGGTNEFGLLVDRYSGKIYRLCLSLCGNGFDAEEAAQEAFIDAFMQLSSLSEPEKFLPWLCCIARRKSYRQIARKRPDEDIDAYAEYLPTEEATPYDELLNREKSRRVALAMGRLSEKKRCVAELFYFKGMKIGEIAQALGLSVNTVKSRLYDAREYLRGELDDMNENKDTESRFESEIKQQIKELSRYYALNGGFDEKYDRQVEQTIELIDKIADEDKRQSYLASALSLQIRSDAYSDEEKKRLRDKSDDAAEKGKNAAYIGLRLIDEYFQINDREAALTFINEKALPKIEGYTDTAEGKSAKGSLLMWRGRAELALGRMTESRADFAAAAQLIDKSDAYYANAVAALRELDYMEAEAYEPQPGFDATAEGLLFDGGRLIFYNQPGFSEYFSIPGIETAFTSFMYYASRCRRTLFDTSMKPGERITDEKNKASLECVSEDAHISAAGREYDGCLHMKTQAAQSWPGDYTLDAWYAPNVGLVRAQAVCDGKTYTYVLSGYTVKGGSGYMPMEVGNRWEYTNPDLPDWLYQRIERRVEYTDGTLTNLSVISPVTLAKHYEDSKELDSSVYLSLCDKLCDNWKLDEALEMLKKGIRLNKNEQSVRIALYGAEVLSRFANYQKKGFRFCPSSINASGVAVTDGSVRFSDPYIASFGPYRLGARGRYEDRIFGVKPFRYLNQFMGKLWDDAWIPGYTEQKDIGEGLTLVFTVEEGGEVTVPAGTFFGCRKLTLRVDKPNDADENWYFADGYAHMHCGVKEYWFAPGVGIVKICSTWGKNCYAECLLGSYSTPAASEKEFLPIQIGNRWEYDEPHLTAEGYRAKAIFAVPSGMNGQYLMTWSQEFICYKTEEEYNIFASQNSSH